MENKQYDKCDTCEQDFKNEVNGLVDNVEGYSNDDHLKKEQEIDGAFSANNSNSGINGNNGIDSNKSSNGISGEKNSCGCGSGKY